MIDWMRYKDRRVSDDLDRQDCWLGRVNNRPLYVIKPKDDALVLMDAVLHVIIATAMADDALDTLKQRAEEHRAEFTEGLFR